MREKIANSSQHTVCCGFIIIIIIIIINGLITHQKKKKGETIMKKCIAIIAAVVTVFTASAAATTEELLQNRLDTAVKAGDWSTAEKISAVMANMATAANQRKQAEFFKQNNEFMTGVMNIYKAAPQLLQIAQRIIPGEKGTEENLFLHTLAPAVIKLISTGEVDPDKIVHDIKEHQKAEKALWAEREKRWQERRSNRR